MAWELSEDRPNFEDLKRFEETIKPPFRKSFGVGRVDLLPPPKPDPEAEDPLARAAGKGKAVFDERNGRLVVPLGAGQACLGVLVVWGVSAEQLHPMVANFLSALVSAGLEMVRLRLLAETDPLTGLFNEQSLDESLAAAISRLKPASLRERPNLAEDPGADGLCLMALEPSGMDSLRERYGRRFGDMLLSELAKMVREAAPGALCAARVGPAFLIFTTGGAAEVRRVWRWLENKISGLDFSTPDGKAFRPVLIMGAAGADASTWRGLSGGNGAPSETAAVFKSRALRALGCAVRGKLGEPLFFNEIVDKAGAITEIMPLDRVTLDLGRVHGLAEGERFSVAGQADDSPKAEILVVKVGEEEAVAEVTALLDPTFSLRPGDRLRRLGQEESPLESAPELEVQVAGRKVRVILDQVTGLPSHRSFVTLFSALAGAEKPFTAGLVRMEGLEGAREVCGAVGAESLMKALANLARERLPKEVLLGRFAPDTLGALWPGLEPEAARAQVLELLAGLGEEMERPVRAGLAWHPCPGFEAGEALANAAKALVHAGFLDPGSAVIFDAVSLNVSGDELFSQGRISEAVVEYEKALGLKTDEVNVLNSLGVCYGHLGQMDKALEHFERARDHSPEDYMAYYNLGYTLMAQGKLSEAKGHLEKSLELNPEHADTLYQLGRLTQNEGRMDQALGYIQKAAEQAEKPKAVHRLLGEVLAAMGKTGEAEEAFKQAVKQKPNDAAALSGLAGLYLDRGANLEIALSLAKRARELEPMNARHVRITARALVALERPAEAADILREAASDFERNPFLAVQLGEVLASLGRRVEARDEYTRALALESNLEAAKQGLAALDESADKEENHD